LRASADALGGRIDLFYSHITSQLSEAEAEAVLADGELRAFLAGAKSEGRVALLGTSCSYPAVVDNALARGLLDDIDVVQLPARTCVSEPTLLARLREAGKLVVCNSPVRRVLPSPEGQVAKAAVGAAMKELLGSCPGVACVLVGTGKPEHLRHAAACVQAFQ